MAAVPTGKGVEKQKYVSLFKEDPHIIVLWEKTSPVSKSTETLKNRETTLSY